MLQRQDIKLYDVYKTDKKLIADAIKKGRHK